ncbi:hypothetical protein B0T21DRAFT_364963 [Apiosordaria backusii]|uniref:Uncharacterized protein n=1 Tax=Apiosordaria backusii TaxID=314023 RepID=A0AA40BN90_9PEZI|nr:hypothetical protein B0T21DRAFT_364963 [Apiosordaria backusii]
MCRQLILHQFLRNHTPKCTTSHNLPSNKQPQKAREISPSPNHCQHPLHTTSLKFPAHQPPAYLFQYPALTYVSHHTRHTINETSAHPKTSTSERTIQPTHNPSCENTSFSSFFSKSAQHTYMTATYQQINPCPQNPSSHHVTQPVSTATKPPLNPAKTLLSSHVTHTLIPTPTTSLPEPKEIVPIADILSASITSLCHFPSAGSDIQHALVARVSLTTFHTAITPISTARKDHKKVRR